MEIFHKTRLIDCHDGAQTHGNSRELPEFRHETRVRIG